MEKDEKDAIEAKTAALAQASAAIAQKLYAQKGEQEAAGSGGGDADSTSEEVVDAEFEEVDEDRKSKSG
jgi:molecular chaperone DnaK